MWPDSDRTQELLRNAREGDAAAIDDLMERHRDALRRLVQMRLDRKIQTRVDVSDVIQDVLIEANRRLPDYLANSAGMGFHLWLRQIARDRIIDAHRRHRVSARRSVDRERSLDVRVDDDRSAAELFTQISDGGRSPAQEATDRELARQIEAAIAELPEHDGEILVMRHFEQLTNQEIAQALGLTEPAASMRYLRALKRLREKLGFEKSTYEGLES
jgi:RNA polymerase sigma-70 factor (ECF subfamily)